MSKAARLADKYILADGRAPPAERRCPISAERTSDMLDVVMFISWHDDGAMWGGIKKEEALAALGRLLGVDPERLRQVARGDGR